MASLPRRLAARLIDAVILTLLISGLFVAMTVTVSVAGPGEGFRFVDRTAASAGDDTALQVGVVAWIAVGLVLLVSYQIVLIALRGATFGKSAAGVRVVRVADGQVPGWSASFLRWLIPFLGLFGFVVGRVLVHLSPLLDGDGTNRGWPDKVAATVVIRT